MKALGNAPGSPRAIAKPPGPADFVAPQRRMSGQGLAMSRGGASYRGGDGKAPMSPGRSSNAFSEDYYSESEGEYEEDHEETPEERRARIKKQNLRECGSICLFFVFLGFFTALVLLEQSASSSRLADHVRAKLDPGTGAVSLESVYDIPSLYEYMEQVIVPSLYENSTDTNMAQDQLDKLNPLDATNRILGTVRLRQVRVKNAENCQVGPLFARYRIPCYPVFGQETESQQAFGIDDKYSYSADITGTPWVGHLGSYNPHGFIELLPINDTLALNKIRELRADDWLGAQTRALFIDFSVWNPNVGTYAVATLVAEFGASGGVRTDVRILTLPQRVLSPGGLGNAGDWIGLFLVLVVSLFLLWFLFEEVQEIWKKRLEYFFDFWNIVDWVNMIMLLAGFAGRMLLFQAAGGAKLGTEALLTQSSFNNLSSLAEQAEMVKLLHAFNALLLWGKVVKYLRFFPLIKNLIRAVWSAFDLFMPFLVMFTVAFVGFTMAYNIGFGDKIFELSTFSRSFIYLCRSFLRDVRLIPVYEITPMFGALLILIFYNTMILVGVNVLFAILADALFRDKYKDHTVEEDPTADPPDEPIQELFREISTRWKRFVKNKIPWLYRRLYRRRRGKVNANYSAEGEADGDGGNGKKDAWGGAMAIKDGSRRAGSAKASDAMSQSSHAFSEYDGFPQVYLPSREDLMKAIEHMSGRILSEISIVGIEIKSELHDVCERVAQMQMAVDELTQRVDEVRDDQERDGLT
jgi:hypothetical protein